MNALVGDVNKKAKNKARLKRKRTVISDGCCKFFKSDWGTSDMMKPPSEALTSGDVAGDFKTDKEQQQLLRRKTRGNAWSRPFRECSWRVQMLWSENEIENGKNNQTRRVFSLFKFRPIRTTSYLQRVFQEKKSNVWIDFLCYTRRK